MEEQYSLFGRKVEYKWIVLSVTTIGALMAAIDSTISSLKAQFQKPRSEVRTLSELPIETTW